MHCPRDNHLLVEAKAASISYWLCPHCHGLLISEKELSASKKAEKIQQPKLDKALPTWKEGTAVSPKTGRLMVVMEINGVKIDRCVDSGLLWLDSGEYDKIIGSFALKSSSKTTNPEEKAGDLLDTVDALEIGADVLEMSVDAVGSVFEFLSGLLP